MTLFKNVQPADSINEAVSLLTVLAESLSNDDSDYPKWLLLKTVIDGLTHTVEKLSA